MEKVNIPAGLLKFDYETAKKDITRAVTRDGRSASELHLFETIEELVYQLAAVIEGRVYWYAKEGRYFADIDGEESGNDLFLRPETVTLYLNVEAEKGMFNTKYYLGYYETEAMAKNASTTKTVVVAQPFTFQPSQP